MDAATASVVAVASAFAGGLAALDLLAWGFTTIWSFFRGIV